MANIEELQETLIPVFRAVEVFNYDPDTIVAWMDMDSMPSKNHHECVDYIREMLLMFFPEATIVDAGHVYTGSHTNVHGWWVQFKL